MRHLVTGACGFIGSHLVDALMERGDEVVAIDNLFTGTRANLAGKYPVSRFDFVRHDVCEPFHFEVDRVWNLACPASPVAYQKNAARTLETAILGTRHALECARIAGASFVQASTSEVYGDPEVHPQPETYWGHVNTLGIRSCYSDDTEVLTKRGWMLFSALTDSDEVATLDERGLVEYVRPIERIREAFDGNLLHFSNSKMDLLVTPNHQMIDERHGRQFLRADSDVEWHHRKTPVGGIWPESEVSAEWALPPRARNAKVAHASVPIEPWLEFVGIYLAEGCVTLTSKTTTVAGKEYVGIQYRVLLAHDNDWKEEKIRACLERLPWSFQELDHQFQIVNKQLVEALEPFGKKSIHKIVPRQYMDLPPSMLRILFDGMMLDGDRARGAALYTSSLALADCAQEIALKIGKAASISVNAERNHWSDLPGYRVNLRPPVKACYPEPVCVAYRGDVYCVTAPPNHTLLVRRNGKAVFCGNCYDEGKRAGETLCFVWNKQFGVDVKIARIFNTYGPRMSSGDGRLIPNFISQRLQKEPVSVYGDGSQTRSFCYVDDTVRGLVALGDLTREKWESRPWPSVDIPLFNLGNPDERTVLSVAESVVTAVAQRCDDGRRIVSAGYSNEIRHESLPQDDPRQRCPDILRAKTILGWEPKVGFDEGLGKTVDWFVASTKVGG